MPPQLTEVPVARYATDSDSGDDFKPTTPRSLPFGVSQEPINLNTVPLHRKDTKRKSFIKVCDDSDEDEFVIKKPRTGTAAVSLHESVKKLKTENETLRAENNQLMETVNSNKIEISRLKGKALVADSSRATHWQSLKKRTEAVRKLEAQLSELQRISEHRQDDIGVLHGEIRRARSAKISQDKKYDEMCSQKKQLQQAYEVIEADMTELRDAITRLKAKSKQARSEHEQSKLLAESKRAEAERDRDMLQQQLNKVKAASRRIRQQVEQSTGQIEQVDRQEVKSGKKPKGEIEVCVPRPKQGIRCRLLNMEPRPAVVDDDDYDFQIKVFP